MKDSSRAIVQQLIDAAGGAGQVDHVWLIDEDEPGDILTPTPQPEEDPNRIYYVNCYSRGALMAFIPKNDIYTAPPPHRMLALDSNMSNSFKRYVLEDERDTTAVVGMQQLIDYAITNSYGVFPIPYILESIFHSGIEAVRTDCEAIMEATIRLRYMEGSIFRNNRSVTYSSRSFDNLDKEYGTRDFRTAAVKATNNLLSQRVPIRSQYFLTYLAVLALIDIGLNITDTDARIAAFDDFLLKRIGGAYPRFMLLARQFFYGKISGWFKTEPGSQRYSASGIRGAGFDIALTMMTEECMQLSNPLDPDVLLLITRDRELARNAPIIRLKGMSVLKNGSLRVFNPWDETLVNAIFGPRAQRVRDDIEGKLAKTQGVEVPPNEIVATIREYEQKLALPSSRLSSLDF